MAAEALSWRDLRLAAWAFPARLIVALTIWGEARNQGATGLAAVAWVIRRRAGRLADYQHACIDPWLFACWRSTEDAHTQALAAMCRGVASSRQLADPTWPTCQRIADGVIAGILPDPVGGADHDLTTDLYQSATCSRWAKALTVARVVGAHTFLIDRTP